MLQTKNVGRSAMRIHVRVTGCQVLWQKIHTQHAPHRPRTPTHTHTDPDAISYGIYVWHFLYFCMLRNHNGNMDQTSANHQPMCVLLMARRLKLYEIICIVGRHWTVWYAHRAHSRTRSRRQIYSKLKWNCSVAPFCIEDAFFFSTFIRARRGIWLAICQQWILYASGFCSAHINRVFRILLFFFIFHSAANKMIVRNCERPQRGNGK